MPAHSVIQSSVLIGRDDVIALAQSRLVDAAAGTGRLLFVAGEAGIGKTRLLQTVATHATINDFHVVRAAAHPGDVQSFAGLLLDLAGDLTSQPEPVLREIGQRLATRIRETAGTGGDAHHRRRLLVQDLVDAFGAGQPSRPVLMILEDLHWADQLSLDVLGRLAARLATRPMLIAGAYRSNELYPDVPMRQLRIRLLSQRLAEEAQLSRLGLDETIAMTTAVLGRAAPARFAAAIFARSDGIPLHIEELLAATDTGGSTRTSGLAVHEIAVPDTLGDAVRGRSRHLRPLTRTVASAAAVIGRSFDFDLLTAVTDRPPVEIAGALRELRDAYLVLPGADAVTFDFRHALIRDTLYADTDLPIRRQLHERVATSLIRGTTAGRHRDALVSAHFEAARHPELAHEHALVAAREATAQSAHTEALELYRRAVRNAPFTLPPGERAALLAALGDEAAATDDNEGASAAYTQAHELLTTAGDIRAAAGLVPRLVAVAHLLGTGLDARVTMLQAAVTSLDGLTGAGRPDRAPLYSAMAAAYMLDRRLDEAIDYAERSRADDRDADPGIALHRATTHGSVLVFAGRMDEGWQLLEDAIGRAAAAHEEAEAARAYRMLGSCASVLVEYDRAEQWLTAGITYAEQVELANDRHYMGAHLAHVQWATGQWTDAAQNAENALADGRGGITTRITAQYVLGYLAMGRGDWATATSLLQDAYTHGAAMGELQRLSPPLWGLAEVARCQGDHDTAMALCARGYAASAAVTDAAYLFPYLLTGVRAHLSGAGVDAAEAWLEQVTTILMIRTIPGTLPAIEHGRGLIAAARGDVAAADRALTSARHGWADRRRFWERGWAALDGATVAGRARRRADAAKLIDEVRRDAITIGAGALVAAADQLSGPLGSRRVEPWHPLSTREFEVARLIAAGRTNRQIAEKLVLAPKTISAHVEHILTKLGAARRAEIATWCATIPTADRSD